MGSRRVLSPPPPRLLEFRAPRIQSAWNSERLEFRALPICPRCSFLCTPKKMAEAAQGASSAKGNIPTFQAIKQIRVIETSRIYSDGAHLNRHEKITKMY